MKVSLPDFRMPRGVSRILSAGALGLAAIAPLATGNAQSPVGQTRSASQRTLGPFNVISANPFLPLFGYFSGEYERSVTGVVSVAVAGSHIKPNNTAYTNLDFKVRLYPNERGLEGFNVAASLGVASIKDDDRYYDCGIIDPLGAPCPARGSFGSGAFAVELGYQWLLGPSKVMVVSVGGGAKRYMAAESKFQNIDRVIPTLRLAIGYAF